MRFQSPCLLLIGLAWPMLNACADPVLRCHIEQSDYVIDLEQRPVSTPYTVQPVMVGTRFRFKAVVLGTPTHIDHVMLYTYSYSHQQASLLHEAVYHQPLPGASTLTGDQVVIEPGLGRELRYQCAVTEGAAS